MGIDNLADPRAELKAMRRSANVQGTASPGGNTSVSEGAFEIRSNEGLIVSGSAKVSGTLAVTGTETVAGTLIVTGTERVDGTLRVTGHFIVDGDQTVNGPLVVAGTFTITGATTLTGNLTVNSPGKITVAGGASPAVLADGSLTFGTGAKLEADGAGARLISGSAGPRVYVFPTAIGVQYDPTHFVQVTGGGVTVKGGLSTDTLSTSSSKQFAIPHPTKPGMTLRHGSTESPVSGIEYWGDTHLDGHGRCEIALPDYFEALAKIENRAVFVTGRGFAADWTDIDDGVFVVTGEPAGRFSWQVKAERRWADFETEDATDG